MNGFSSKFHQLCKSLCEAAGSSVPPLDPDLNGDMAIEVGFGDVSIAVSHEPGRAPAHAHVSVIFGPLPPGRALAASQALMELNTVMLKQCDCTFARHPDSGEIVLRYPYRLSGASALDLYGRLVEFAEIARAWREHHFLSPAGHCSLGMLAPSQ